MRSTNIEFVTEPDSNSSVLNTEIEIINATSLQAGNYWLNSTTTHDVICEKPFGKDQSNMYNVFIGSFCVESQIYLL